MSASVFALLVALGDDWDGHPDFSPTQISSHIECERKWAWRRIAKIEVVPHASAQLGTRSHTVLERYLGNGTSPDFVADREAAGIASSGLHLLPSPMTPGMRLERQFRFQSRRTGFVYGGLKDVEIEKGVPVPSLEFDGIAPIVIDHKTTSSIDKWAKTTSDLEYDAQATIYGLDSMVRFDATQADLAWVYYQTKGAKRASPTKLRLEATHALKVFDAIERVAEKASVALVNKLHPLDLPPNPSACSAYGGCPYRHLCNLSPSQAARSRMSNSIIAGLRARVQETTEPVITEIGAAAKPSLFGDPKDLPAVTEVPAALLGTPPTPVVEINPPESKLPPPSLATEEQAKPKKTDEQIAAEGPQTTTNGKRRGRARNPSADPKGADAHAAVTITAEKEELEKIIEATTKQGFTLYVDCLPIGRPARYLAKHIETAQGRMLAEGPQDKDGQRPCDYRLADFGKGAPFLVKFVLEAIDPNEDLVLDTRSPEGTILLEPLSARASFVVRGFR